MTGHYVATSDLESPAPRVAPTRPRINSADSISLPGTRPRSQSQASRGDADEDHEDDEYVCNLIYHFTGITECPVTPI
jgi:hypothetical protein